MDTSPKNRFRFSLLTFLLAATLVCLALSHWSTSRQLATAQSELRRLRDELGYMSIDDRHKFHAVALDCDEPNTWQWRMFVPKGARYKWNIANAHLVHSRLRRTNRQMTAIKMER